MTRGETARGTRRRARLAAALTAGVAASALLAGCARVVVREGGGETGLRIDPPRPYLLVTAPASPPGIPPPRRTAELVLLPDLDHPQWVRVRPGLGAVSASVTLAHGMLAAYEEEVDGQAAALLEAVGRSLSSTIEGLATATAVGPGPGDGLATTTELLEIRARDDGDLELVPVPSERARRLLARVRDMPPAQRVRVGP